MRLSKFLLWVLIAMLVSFLSTSLFYAYYLVQDAQQLDMKLKVGDTVGLDVNTSVISFGVVPIGGSSERRVVLRNVEDKPLRVSVKKSGEMAGWVYVSEDDFILGANEGKELIFTVIPSGNAEKGEYNGRVRFVFKRVLG